MFFSQVGQTIQDVKLCRRGKEPKFLLCHQNKTKVKCTYVNLGMCRHKLFFTELFDLCVEMDGSSRRMLRR